MLDASHATAAGSIAVCVFALYRWLTAGAIRWRISAAPFSPVLNPSSDARTIVAVLTLFGGLVWLARISMLVGGPLALVRLFFDGSSVADLKSAVYIPAQLPPITTMVHLAPAAASMLVVQRRLGNGWKRIELLLFVAILALAALRSLVLAERLAAVGVAAAVAVTWVICSQDLSPRRVFTLAAAGVAILWFAWSAGESGRAGCSVTPRHGAALTLRLVRTLARDSGLANHRLFARGPE